MFLGALTLKDERPRSMKYLVGTKAEFSDENRKIVTIAGQRIVVFTHESNFHALSAVCPHMGGPVGEGLLLGRVEGVVAADGQYMGDRFSSDTIDLVCPWHGWEYDIRTGQSAGQPKVSLNTYKTEIDKEDVYIHV